MALEFKGPYKPRADTTLERPREPKGHINQGITQESYTFRLIKFIIL